MWECMMGMDNDPVEIEIHQTTFHQIKSHETNHNQRNLFQLFVLWIIKSCLSCHIHFHLLISRIQICKNSDYVGDILGRHENVSFLLQFLCMFLPGRHQSGPNIKKLFEPHLTWLLSWQGASAGWREGSVRQQPSLLFCQNSPEVALGRSSDNIELVDFGSRGCK